MGTSIEWLRRFGRTLGTSQAELARSVESPEGRTAGPAPLSRPLRRWLTLFVSLGLLARAVRFGLCFPLWDDESFLCANFIDRTYRGLMEPLDYHQVAPLLFLWVEHTAVKLFGFTEYALRLFPFVCSLLSVLLFRRIASRLLSGPGLLIAVGIFAVSYPGIRYAAEAKPYGSDLFVSLVLLSLTVEWLEHRTAGWLWALAAATPVAIGLSYPAVFAAGGLSLVAACRLWKSSDGQASNSRAWRLWIAWNIILIASFLAWFRLCGGAQTAAEMQFMGAFWKRTFPPIAQPWRLPLWLLSTHASDFLAYPLGGPNWASTFTLLLCLTGLWQLVRMRRGVFLGLALAPVGLHFFAAAIERYPYGGHVKFSQYAAPMICCVAAVGAIRWIDFSLRRRPAWSRFGLALPAAVLVLIGAGTIGRDMRSPYKTACDFRARAFAQGFWFNVRQSEEVVCVKADLGLDFSPGQYHELSWSAQFLCNRAMEMSRWRLPPSDLRRVTAHRPLRCVVYRDERFYFDRKAFDRWLAEMDEQFKLVSRETFVSPRFRRDDHSLVTTESVDSYVFVPRHEAVAAQLPRMTSRRGSAN